MARKERFPDLDTADDAGFEAIVRISYDALIWQEDALCKETDPEIFFPEKGGSTKEAKKVCGRCEVEEECREYALANNERYGVWGGLSEYDRRKIAAKKISKKTPGGPPSS